MFDERLNCFTDLIERLPHRLLYAGEIISIQLVGLQLNRALIHYRSPEWILLLVAFGRVQVHTDEAFFTLNEGEAFQLNPLCEYDITTNQVADLLLITMPSKVQPSGAVHVIQESCRCHSTNFSESITKR